ncbi:hypothetical protein O9929_18650 [Vibrio lentus]|nr:hypothetical protein [Vibrio lentus]
MSIVDAIHTIKLKMKTPSEWTTAIAVEPVGSATYKYHVTRRVPLMRLSTFSPASGRSFDVKGRVSTSATGTITNTAREW